MAGAVHVLLLWDCTYWYNVKVSVRPRILKYPVLVAVSSENRSLGHGPVGPTARSRTEPCRGSGESGDLPRSGHRPARAHLHTARDLTAPVAKGVSGFGKSVTDWDTVSRWNTCILYVSTSPILIYEVQGRFSASAKPGSRDGNRLMRSGSDLDTSMCLASSRPLCFIFWGISTG